jgi:hypothetical protein
VIPLPPEDLRLIDQAVAEADDEIRTRAEL